MYACVHEDWKRGVQLSIIVGPAGNNHFQDRNRLLSKIKIEIVKQGIWNEEASLGIDSCFAFRLVAQSAYDMSRYIVSLNIVNKSDWISGFKFCWKAVFHSLKITAFFFHSYFPVFFFSLCLLFSSLVGNFFFFGIGSCIAECCKLLAGLWSGQICGVDSEISKAAILFYIA